MKRALILRFSLIVVIVVIICSAVTTLLAAQNETEAKKHDMLSSLALMAEIYNSSDKHDHNLANHLSELSGNSRVTFINANGEVFVDTFSHNEPIDNHSDREEVILAKENGSGFIIRQSITVGESQIYAAKATKNGDIIRISYSVNGIIDYVMTLTPVILGAILISTAAGLLLAGSMAKSILKPINQVSQALYSMKNGDYSKKIAQNQYSELDELIGVFNSMRKQVLDNTRKLERAREKESFILDSLNDGVVLFDKNMEVASANPASLKLLGKSDYEQGDSLLKLVRYSSIISAAEKAILGDTISSLDITIEGKVINIQIFPVKSNSIKPEKHGHGVLMVMRDITEKRLSEQMRQDFFANAGHELKTPLTAIIGFAELLESGFVSEEKRDYYMEKILYEAKRMSVTISDILEISRLENGGKIDEIVECNLLDICRSVAENVAPTANEKGINVDVSGNGFILKAAYKHIYELVENLVSNAVKYNKPDGSVFITAESSGTNGVIIVRDTGIGINKDCQQRVFERFFRVDKGRSTKEGSTGLGLSIVKHIVNRYMGTVNLQSEINEGTTVTVQFPSVNK